MEGVASVIFGLDPMAERTVLNFFKKNIGCTRTESGEQRKVKA